jgi:hypothetical protein
MLLLYLRDYIINIFKIKQIIYTLRVIIPPPIHGMCLGAHLTLAHFVPEDAGSKLGRTGNIQPQTS